MSVEETLEQIDPSVEYGCWVEQNEYLNANKL
jgi:hypothetical protein